MHLEASFMLYIVQASLTIVTYDRNMFIVQATAVFQVLV